MHKQNEADLVLFCCLLTTLLKMHKKVEPSQQIIIIIRHACTKVFSNTNRGEGVFFSLITRHDRSCLVMMVQLFN